MLLSFRLVPVVRYLFRINEFILEKVWGGEKKVWGEGGRTQMTSACPLLGCSFGYDNRDLALRAKPLWWLKSGNGRGTERRRREGKSIDISGGAPWARWGSGLVVLRSALEDGGDLGN